MKVILGAFFCAATVLAQSTEPANSRNIQVADDGVIIATSNAKGPFLFKQSDSATTITIALPSHVDSMDDISISDEGYLFGISVFTPTLCSFEIITANLNPLGCINPDFSVEKYTGLSCKAGKCVISGGTGGYTVVEYDRNTGVLIGQLRCINCQVNTVGNTELTDLNYVEVAVIASNLASLSTISGGEDNYSIIVNLDTNQMEALHSIPDAVSVDLAVTPTNYPCVSDFYRASTGEDFMFTACGSLTVQSVLNDSAPVTISLPEANFTAVTIAVDAGRNLFAVGGNVMGISYLAVYNIDPANPGMPIFENGGTVEGTILSVAMNQGLLAFVTLESEIIQTMNISPAPSATPSSRLSGSPSMSSSPSLGPTIVSAVDVPSTGAPTPAPVPPPPTSAGPSIAVCGTLMLSTVITWIQL